VITDMSKMRRADFEKLCRATARGKFASYKDGEPCPILGGNANLHVRAGEPHFSKYIVEDGFWESWVTLAFLKLLKPGQVVINIGANLGYFSAIAAEAVGPSGYVLAVEANPELMPYLKRTMSAFPHSSVENVALVGPDFRGDTVVLSMPGEEFMVASTSPGFGTGKSFSVQAATMSQIATAAVGRHTGSPKGKVDVIFADAEGAEEHVIGEHLEEMEFPTLILEWAPARYKYPSSKIGMLRDMGYTDHWCNFDGGFSTIDADKLGAQWTMMAFSKGRPSWSDASKSLKQGHFGG